MQGIEQPGQINVDALKKLRAGKSSVHSVQELLDGIFAGNRTILSQAITLVESSHPKHQAQAQELIGCCLKNQRLLPDYSTGEIPDLKYEFRVPSIRIGITGVPGVGKSTFIEALGTSITAKGHKLAVLAVDPSSSRSKGSILGDKTRMEELAADPNAFIRPSPSAGSLGGVARKTRETIVLCEAAGFDVIFVETVGVGQSETTVHSMVDFFLLLMLAGAGDELQGIKRGIIEMADAIMINKADGDNINKAKAARVEYANALRLFPLPESSWIPVADICSARSKLGIDRVWEIITEYLSLTIRNGYFQHHRMEQNKQILLDTIESGLQQHFFTRKDISNRLLKIDQDIMAGRVNPYTTAQELLDQYFKGSGKVK